MMGQSNDWFYGPGESGIELFKDGQPINGDITSQIILWDVGTESGTWNRTRTRARDKKDLTPGKPKRGGSKD